MYGSRPLNNEENEVESGKLRKSDGLAKTQKHAQTLAIPTHSEKTFRNVDLISDGLDEKGDDHVVKIWVDGAFRCRIGLAGGVRLLALSYIDFQAGG